MCTVNQVKVEIHCDLLLWTVFGEGYKLTVLTTGRSWWRWLQNDLQGRISLPCYAGLIPISHCLLHSTPRLNATALTMDGISHTFNQSIINPTIYTSSTLPIVPPIPSLASLSSLHRSYPSQPPRSMHMPHLIVSLVPFLSWQAGVEGCMYCTTWRAISTRYINETLNLTDPIERGV